MTSGQQAVTTFLVPETQYQHVLLCTHGVSSSFLVFRVVGRRGTHTPAPAERNHRRTRERDTRVRLDSAPVPSHAAIGGILGKIAAHVDLMDALAQS